MIEFVRERFLHLLRLQPQLACSIQDFAAAQQLFGRVVDEVLDYGPLEPFLRDESISQITVIGPQLIYVERKSHTEEACRSFEDVRHLTRISKNMLWRAGRDLAAHWPITEFHLPRGFPCAYDHATKCRKWTNYYPPQMGSATPHYGTADTIGIADAGDGTFSACLRAGSPQYSHLRRERFRQNNSPECTERFYLTTGAYCD